MKIFFSALFSISAFLPFIAQAEDTPPTIIDSKCIRPEYPHMSLKNQETGTVVFSLLIDVDGSVIDSKIDVSSGFRSLDRAVLVNARECKFNPGTNDGHKEKMWIKQSFVWNLPGDTNDVPLSH